MQTAKENIVEQAKLLFNEKGYYHVTMRDIAKAAGTTIGNLTYHFPKKQDLVLEIQKDANSNLLPILEQRLAQKAYSHSLEEIFDTFLAIEKNEREFSYYFHNLMELGGDYPEIYASQQQIRSVFLQYFHTAFLDLVEKQILRADISDQCCHALSRAIVLLMTIWNQNSSPTYDRAFCNYSFFQTCTDLLYPYFTEKGQTQFKGLCRETNEGQSLSERENQ